MKYLTLFLMFGLVVILTSCDDKTVKTNKSVDVPIMDFSKLKPLLSIDNDTTYVINFWATWCNPCVKEIPHFEQLAQELSGSKVVFILVNLDFSNHYESRLLPFIKRMKIKSRVVMLDDPNSNYWINEVNPQWTGAIPATLIYKRQNRSFFEKEFTYEELNSVVKSFL